MKRHPSPALARRCTRLLSVLTFLCLPALPASAVAPEALDIDKALGAGASLELRSREGGVELTWRPASDGDGPSSISARLAPPRGSSAASRKLTLDEARRPVTALLPRPAGKSADHDLRLVVSTGTKRDWVMVASRLLMAPRIMLLGDPRVHAGSRYAPRVVVRAGAGSGGLAGATVTATLVTNKGRSTSQRVVATTDGSGAAPLLLAIPDNARGEHRVDLVVESEDGRATASYPVQVVRGARVLLSTDKPIYQPGQTIHVRLLALAAGSGKASGKAAARFAIHDARNNKVFQKRGKTSAEGVFATTFPIASMVNTGRWRIEAEVAGTKVERTVEVKPYVLPKFKVELKTDRSSYRPGEQVRGTVSARYFFGKPLKDAKVRLTAATFDVAARELTRASFELDEQGAHSFAITLPKVLHGQPLLKGAASVRLTARVTDTAGQTYQGTRTLVVYKDPLRISAIPEAGRLVPGVPNSVFVVVTRPDGSPVKGATVKVGYQGPAQTLQTDATGVAEWRGTPKAGVRRFKLEAATADGARVTRTVDLNAVGNARTHVLLRPRQPAPRAGETVEFDVHIGGAVPHVFLDLVKDGQTLLTLSAPVRHDGKATLKATLPHDAAGTVLAHAYAIGDDMEVYADTRPMVVRQASDLAIRIAPGKQTYRPGEEMSVDLKVTDGAGHPVLAALGLWVVDEAVFALSELRPGMEKVFFLLEREIMKPKVEIHGFVPEQTVLDDGPKNDQVVRRDRAARVLAAASLATFDHANKHDSRAEQATQSREVWREALDKRFTRVRKKLRGKILARERMLTGEQLYQALAKANLEPAVDRDPFGVPYRCSASRQSGELYNASVTSAGPDTRFGTSDDVSIDLGLGEAWNKVRERQDRREQRRWEAQMRKRHGPNWRRRMRRPKFAMRAAGAGPPMVMEDAVFGAGPVESARVPATSSPSGAKKSGGAQVRVRSFFPETLYVNPLVLTDKNGHARVTFPGADSITTWRMSALASTAAGLLGSASQGLRVFQDFFVDVDLPVSLTRGDEVSVPLAVYNYLQQGQTVKLEIEAEGGLNVMGDRVRKVKLGPGEVRGLSITLLADRVGSARLTVTARGSSMSDAVRRVIRVEPDGFPVTGTRSGMLSQKVSLDFDVPKGAIEHASTLQLKLFPGMFAQVVDGLESILRMPGGCFEQTSSSTYPNLLVLRYLRDAEKTKPELEAKALRYIQAGWQRLVTFEVQGGGFSWFGRAPANQILTAYGLMEFHDMDRVYAIDRKVITRTREWLLSKQSGDGSFQPDKAFLHQESWGDIQKSSVLVTAYIAWALAYTRPDRKTIEPRLRKALDWLAKRIDQANDAYVLAYLGNAFAEAIADRNNPGADADVLTKVLGRLAGLAERKGGKLHFPTKLRTATYGSGVSATIEVTALALRAFMRGRQHLDVLGPGLEWLVESKGPHGHWHSTQATIQVLQAMVGSLSAQQEPSSGSVVVKVNGEPVSTVEYTPDDFDVVRFVDASKHLRTGKNHIELQPSQGLKAMYSATAVSYLPWKGFRGQEPKAKQPFEVTVDYDRSELAKDDTVGVSVRVKSNLPGTAKMGIVDVAVPPGFDLITDSLQAAVQAKRLHRYSQAGRQLILYVEEFSPKAPFEISFKLRARYPLRVSTGSTRAYEYYNPANDGVALPATVKVK